MTNPMLASMTSLGPVLGSLLASSLLVACVAKDPDSLGELESGNEDASSGGATEGETTGEDTEGPATSGSSTEGESSSDTGTVDACPDPALSHYEPSGCPGDEVPILPEAGCYEPCEGPESACAVGTCAQVEINPCVCPEGGDCCAACGSVEWLCVEGLPDAVCEAIVGTTFLSVDELECGQTPMGPVLCNWQIDFGADGSYLWMYSDVGEGGDYTCEGGVITVLNNPALAVSYDAVTGILTWDGVDYEAAP